MEDNAGSGQAVDNILICQPDCALQAQVWEKISAHVPGARFEVVHSLAECRRQLDRQRFEVVVLDLDLQALHRSLFLHELEVRDHSPGVVVISAAWDPQLVSQVCAISRRRFVLKDGDWSSEVGPVLRYLLRIVRMEEEYEKVRAQLTEANQILRDKNRRLDEFSMTLAHDIRGPLGGISMNLEYVLDTYADELPQRSRHLLQRALDTSARLTKLVQAMYQYAKLGAQASNMAQVALTQLVHEVVVDLHFHESLDIQVGIGELPGVWGNAELLRRVFSNLISNAVKYNDKQAIVVNVACEGLVEQNLGRYCRISVSDNGPGIAADDLENLFSMFSRSAAVSSHKEGLGVGLAVVQRIVELHSGQVTAESKLGEGTRFVLTLPVEKNDLVG